MLDLRRASGMMKSVEKIHKPSASFSLNPKQVKKSRFEPRSFEPLETEHEISVDMGVPYFSYNLMNVPVYPPVQRKEAEDEEEIQMATMLYLPGLETPTIQRTVNGDITQQSISPEWAKNLTDQELDEQIHAKLRLARITTTILHQNRDTTE
jgi:hypothetical protein